MSYYNKRKEKSLTLKPQDLRQGETVPSLEIYLSLISCIGKKIVFTHVVNTNFCNFRCSFTSWMKSSAASEENRQPYKAKNKEDPLKFISRLEPATPTKIIAVKSDKPKKHKEKILIWSDLTLDAINRLNECHGYDQIRQVLASIFLLGNYKQSLKAGIVLDLYYYTLQFAKEEQFSPEKTSVLFSIIKRIFEVCIETPYGNLDHTFEYFKELLMCHSVNLPPTSLELFTPEEVMKISNYVLNTFFRHFKLYKYVFTAAVRLDLTLNYIGKPPSPQLTEDVGSLDEEEDDEEAEAEYFDVEKLKAQEELKRVVTDFLTKEAKRIEGNIDQHLKVAVDALNAKIDPLFNTGSKNVKGKKK